MNQFPCLIRTSIPGGEARYALGDPLVDSYLAFVAGRSRPNMLARGLVRKARGIPDGSSVY
jgi:hypothetical protein